MRDSVYVTKTRLPLREEFFRQIGTVVDTAWLTNDGECVRTLERRLQEYLGVPHLLVCNNGTTALMLAIQCAGLAHKKIAVTPYTYVATLSALLWMDCTPVFIDIDPGTLCLSPQLLHRALQEQPDIAGVLPVHVYGFSCDIDRLESICREHGATLIYDAAQAFGSSCKGKSLLDYGDYSICSFHATKLFHTAEGGCVVSHSDEAHRALSLARAFGHIGDTHYTLGINAKMSELHAALGLTLLPGTQEEIDKRQNLHRVYDKALEGANLTKPRVLDTSFSWNYSYYPVLLQDEATLLRVMCRLAEQNIYPRRYFYPSLNTLEYLRSEWRGSCPVSENTAARVLCLPLHGDLAPDIAETVSRFLVAELPSSSLQ